MAGILGNPGLRSSAKWKKRPCFIPQPWGLALLCMQASKLSSVADPAEPRAEDRRAGARAHGVRIAAQTQHRPLQQTP
eukprot:gene22756-biopygen19278